MPYSILIVDDSDIIRAMVIRTITLTKLPVENFLEAKNGAEALAILKKNWIDIVFTDLNMPVLNGFDMIAQMKDSVDLIDIPVVVITTEGNIHRIDELKKMGVKECLRKPFTPEKIRDIIISQLGVWDEK